MQGASPVDQSPVYTCGVGVQRVRVRVLGGFAVDGIDSGQLGSRKARTLLKRLVLARGRPVSVDVLAETLWPDQRPAKPADQVSVLVSRLRAVLGADRLPRVEAGYAIRADWLDLDVLAERVDELERRLAAGTPAAARAAATAALELARGPLLPDEESDAEWLAAERTAADQLIQRTRIAAGRAALIAGDAWLAGEEARRALAAEPYDEAAVRLLVAALAGTGRPALAITAYTGFAQRLRDELGIDPSKETETAYLDLLRGQAPARVERRPGVDIVGRDAELAALDSELEAARGVARIVSVEGESGIGKTRLLESWAAGVREQGTVVLWATGEELTGAPPLQPILDALREHLRRIDADQVDLMLGADGPLVGPLIWNALPRQLAQIGHPAGPLATEGVGQTVLYGALAGVISRLAGAGPIVLVLDDAQWVDQSTVAWVHYCTRRASEARLLVVLGRRPEEGLAYRADQTITLGPLDLAATATIVGLDGAAELYARTGGHPLFLIELSRSGTHDVLPGSITTAVAERADRAGPAAATLRAAAVLGADIDLDLLAGVLQRPAAELLDDLEEGARRHLLVERMTGFSFPHQLIREALLAATGANRRAMLHREAARWLAARPGAQPLDIAYHARQGGDLMLAARALDEAAAVAVQRLDHGEANRLLDEAIATDGSAERRVRRARARVLATRFHDALADAVAAIEQGAGAPAFDAAATASYYLRDFDGVLRYAAEGARLATDPEVRASCLTLSGRVLHGLGDLRGADERLAEAISAGGVATRPVAEVWRAWLLVHRGDPATALEVLPDQATVEHSHNPLVTPNLHLATGFARAMLGRPAAALADFERSEQASARLETDRALARSSNCKGWIFRNLGDYGRADELNQHGYDSSTAQDTVEPRMHALLDLADGRLRVADLDGAAGVLQRYREEFTPHVFAWRNEWRSMLLSARLALAGGDGDRAAALAAEVMRRAAAQEQGRYETLARLVLAECAHDSGESADLDAIGRDLVALVKVAPLEAWWLTAQAAATFGVDAWRRLAAERVVALAAESGRHADTLRAAASRVLG